MEITIGNTSIHCVFSKANQGWMVWRSDSGLQSGLRIYNEKDEAIDDFDRRVEFLTEVTQQTRRTK